MIADCPACRHEMQVQPDGFSAPHIVCGDCGERFTTWEDWINLTPLWKLRYYGRRARLKLRAARIRVNICWLLLTMKWNGLKIEFYKLLLAIAEPTPEQSEALTGIEVTEDDE